MALAMFGMQLKANPAFCSNVGIVVKLLNFSVPFWSKIITHGYSNKAIISERVDLAVLLNLLSTILANCMSPAFVTLC